MGEFRRQLKAMLRKNWLLKIRHPFATAAEILLPTVVMLLLIAVRTRMDTQLHPAQPYIKKGLFVEVGKSEISPSFDGILERLAASGERLAFVPDTKETRMMLDFLSILFPLLRGVGIVYHDELELETYIRSDHYGRKEGNCSYPKIKGAIIFHEQGPMSFDYSIRLNHSWAFSGFPDVNTIMDTNGPYYNDLDLGVSSVPTLQYGLSGFLTLQQVMDSFIIFASQQRPDDGALGLYNFDVVRNYSSTYISWKQFNPSNIRIAPFPTRAFTDDEFQSIVKSVMGVLYLLGYLYPVSRLISYSVYEKEQKIKEGLHMMGLRDDTFYISWFLTYCLQFAVSAGILTACTMSSLFIYSDKSLVFTYFFSFGLSTITFAFLISTFFSRAKTAVAVGTLSFLGAFFPYYTVNDPAVPMLSKVLVSFLSPTAFALGTVNFADYEHAHVGVRWSNIWQASSGVNFLVCLLMMIWDAVMYLGFGLYLDKVLPKENGVSYPWNFIFTKRFWSNKCMVGKSPEADSMGDLLQGDIANSENADDQKPTIENVSLDMRHQEVDNRCIQIRDLHKMFVTKKGRCCAVNSLCLTLYENQILALLGHNGAGKSTTISMLVGLLPPTSGDALVLGKNISTHMDDIRKSLGVCPQHDILFPELTVKEHLEIYAILKGVQEDIVEVVVNDMIDEVGLVDKINTRVGALSGGMRRKLSLGIALIGNSKIIILDEPTSGMDPYSMRSTWQLIKKIKKGRIILLTTHSMDEADVLGDRIAIMSNGSLRCCGSSLFLKHLYGVGYTLTLVKASPSTSVASDIVLRHVPTAECISEAGMEVSFRLPLSSSTAFEAMFREIESCITKEANTSGTRDHANKYLYGIESYGISVTTLEEVFLKVAGSNYDEADNFERIKPQIESITMASQAYASYPVVSESKSCFAKFWKISAMILSIVGRGFSLIFSMILSLLTFVNIHCCGCGIFLRSSFWRHFRALLIKRAISARRDRRTIVFQLLIPAVFLFLGLLFLKLKPHPDQLSVTFTTSHFNPLLRGGGGGGPVPFNLVLSISKKVAAFVKGGWIQEVKPSSYRFPNAEKVLLDAIDVAGPTLGPTLISLSEYLITSLNESYQSRYGAIVMDDLNEDGSLGYTVLHNSTCQHGAPTYINLMNAAILRLATDNKNMTIQTRNHPLPMTGTQQSQHHDLDAFSAAIIVNIAFTFVPASFAVAIVKEREIRAKHQQLISGVSLLSYWLSTYIWDFISFLFPASFAIILFYIFGLDQFIGGDCLLPTTAIFLEYGLAVAASTYCLTFCFSDHSVAQNVILFIHFFTGLILMLISFIMGLIPTTKTANTFLKKFFRLSPGFCFADGLASLALRRQGVKLASNHGILDWNVTGASICYLAMESILYFLCVIAFEYFPMNKLDMSSIARWVGNCGVFARSFSDTTLEPLLNTTKGPDFDADEDVDVKTERDRVLSGASKDAIIYLHNLHKVYLGLGSRPTKVAVHSLTFVVQEGECFGFLGTNGAGKTTTLSMLSGDESISGGTACIFGNDIRLHPKAARRHVGYCPQFDALLELLTVQEHLELYARIKGVPETRLNNVVIEKMLEFDLLQHAEKPSYCLSGGNKRKLSVAIAMIGNPPIVILDEPSTGMDPVAKRFMWEVISQLSTRQGKTAVILTTHSMNEAQALCTRIGIMVGGRLRCIGSPQHLKSRFGNHLELEMKLIEVGSSELDSLCREIQDMLFERQCHPRNILADLEICIGGSEMSGFDDVAEISLSREMIIAIGNWFGNTERTSKLTAYESSSSDFSGEQLSEQLIRDGGIPLRIFSEWWLAAEKFSIIDSFINSSFPGSSFQGSNGMSLKYQLPYGDRSSLADIFGHLERSRCKIGIAEYSISQSTLESIFNHFAAATVNSS